MHEPTSIERDLLAALKGQPLHENQFNALALDVFCYQFSRNPAYQNFCKDSGIQPDKISQWQDIPAIPTDAFKHTEYPLATFPLENALKTFLTSGTTSEIKGHHHFPSTRLYEQSIIGVWRELDLPQLQYQHPIFLTPSPEQAPTSSLSHMMGVLANSLTGKPTWTVNDDGQLEIDAITSVANLGLPVALIGTALAFLHLFESIDTPLSLPAGSWAMETGGYKGTKRQLKKQDLYRLFHEKLKLAPDSIINEYSMTELSSQFYTRGLNQAHSGPSWTRVRVIDPITNQESKPGQAGHLVIYDLANLHSVMAIRTQDIAIRTEADLALGHNSFTLLGRDPSALPRGCSRAADQSLRP